MGRCLGIRLLLLLVSVTALGLAAGCSTTYERRDPTGKVFPSVEGTALDNKNWRIPEDFAGAPVLILVGYKQNSQFDIDRWLLGLCEAGVKVRAFEVPTIPGLMPGAFSGYIDAGMRSGIPSEDWGGVITLYGDAAVVARFTGNEIGLPARVLLLDSVGQGRLLPRPRLLARHAGQAEECAVQTRGSQTLSRDITYRRSRPTDPIFSAEGQSRRQS